MSAMNFEIMRDFPLFAKNYMAEVKRCPVCGAIQDIESEVCEFCETDELESGYETSLTDGAERIGMRSPPRWMSLTVSFCSTNCP